MPSVISMCDSAPQQIQHKGNTLCFEGQNRTSDKVDISKAVNDWDILSFGYTLKVVMLYICF